jgi:aminopeptidase YwaD
MKYSLVFLFAVILCSCTKRFNPEITVKDLKTTIGYLASDSLKGRDAGSTGDMLAANYIKGKFEAAGLNLLFDKGFQKFKIVKEVELGEGNLLAIGSKNFVAGTDFRPYSISANKEFSGKVVFAGYGFDFKEDSISWNDFEGTDVKGKWALILKGDPEVNNSQSVFIKYSDERSKVLAAVDHSAGGILLVSGPVFSAEDELSPMFYDKNSSTYEIPVIQITRAVADEILKNSGKTVADLESSLNKNWKPGSFDIDFQVSAKTNVIQKQVESENIAAILPGIDSVLKNQYIIIGAHHDHLGMGGPGSGSRALDTIAIHNGADDNASGVAAVIELAEKAASEKTNRRTLVFVTFGAEELGLVGSNAFVSKPPIDLLKVDAMFNFDMVGRLDTATNALSIGGTKTALENETLLNKFNKGFNLAFSGEGTGPSDHSSFYLQNIPVFFISTGAHGDYHTPYDDADKINYEGEKKVVDYSYNLIKEVTNSDKKLTFQEAGSTQRQGRGARYKITLGLMPDFAGVEKRGMRVDAVTKGKPAYNGGIVKGDIITAINGKTVTNIYDYMNRLNTLKAGQTISIDILRDNKEMVLIIQL